MKLARIYGHSAYHSAIDCRHNCKVNLIGRALIALGHVRDMCVRVHASVSVRMCVPIASIYAYAYYATHTSKVGLIFEYYNTS
jgi:hypothetical protein